MGDGAKLVRHDNEWVLTGWNSQVGQSEGELEDESPGQVIVRTGSRARLGLEVSADVRGDDDRDPH